MTKMLLFIYFRWRSVGQISKIQYSPSTVSEPLMLDEIEGDIATLTAPRTETLKVNIHKLNVMRRIVQ